MALASFGGRTIDKAAKILKVHYILHIEILLSSRRPGEFYHGVFGVFLDELKCTFIGIDHLFVLRSGFTPLSCNCSEVNDVDGTSISLQFTALTGMDGLHCVWSSSFPIQLHFDATRRMNC